MTIRDVGMYGHFVVGLYGHPVRIDGLDEMSHHGWTSADGRLPLGVWFKILRIPTIAISLCS